MEKHDWIIGICCSASDGVNLWKFSGTKDEVKAKLFSLIEEDRENDFETWEHGTESIDEIAERNTIREIVEGNCVPELYGYGSYYDYHIDYSAKVIDHIEII